MAGADFDQNLGRENEAHRLDRFGSMVRRSLRWTLPAVAVAAGIALVQASLAYPPQSSHYNCDAYFPQVCVTKNDSVTRILWNQESVPSNIRDQRVLFRDSANEDFRFIRSIDGYGNYVSVLLRSGVKGVERDALNPLGYTIMANDKTDHTIVVDLCDNGGSCIRSDEVVVAAKPQPTTGRLGMIPGLPY